MHVDFSIDRGQSKVKFQIKQLKIFESLKLPFYKEIYKDIGLSTIHKFNCRFTKTSYYT